MKLNFRINISIYQSINKCYKLNANYIWKKILIELNPNHLMWGKANQNVEDIKIEFKFPWPQPQQQPNPSPDSFSQPWSINQQAINNGPNQWSMNIPILKRAIRQKSIGMFKYTCAICCVLWLKIYSANQKKKIGENND